MNHKKGTIPKETMEKLQRLKHISLLAAYIDDQEDSLVKISDIMKLITATLNLQHQIIINKNSFSWNLVKSYYNKKICEELLERTDDIFSILKMIFELKSSNDHKMSEKEEKEYSDIIKETRERLQEIENILNNIDEIIKNKDPQYISEDIKEYTIDKIRHMKSLWWFLYVNSIGFSCYAVTEHQNLVAAILLSILSVIFYYIGDVDNREIENKSIKFLILIVPLYLLRFICFKFNLGTITNVILILIVFVTNIWIYKHVVFVTK